MVRYGPTDTSCMQHVVGCRIWTHRQGQHLTSDTRYLLRGATVIINNPAASQALAPPQTPPLWWLLHMLVFSCFT